MYTLTSSPNPNPAAEMADLGYLRGRLPPLNVDDTILPIGAEEFSGLLLDAQQKEWAAGCLDWLRLANRQSIRRHLPAPYPDLQTDPLLAWPDDPWPAYYHRYSSIAAPSLIREWAMEDAALMSSRAELGGRDLGLPTRGLINRRAEGLIQSASPELKPAGIRDRKLVRFYFQWLDEQMFVRSPDSTDWVYAYAIKLLVMTREGRRANQHAAA